MKGFIDNDQGFVHTLEAIIGTIIIIGVIIFTTGSFPYTAQKTGEHSKIQLADIGRDSLDLIELTPITDIFSNYSRSSGVYRQYTLVADKTIVAPGENINFTVYYLDTNQIVNKTLTLEQTILGLKNPIGTKPINGSTNWSFSTIGEYNIRAYEGSLDSPTGWSNYTTITVGYYFLYSDVDGVSTSSPIVNGSVYNSSGFGIPNLTIQVLDNNYNVVNSSATLTTDNGSFSFNWSDLNLGSGNNAGTYYIKAIGPLGGSNKHLVIFSSMGGYIYSDEYYIFETDSTNINLVPDGNFNKFVNTNNFEINSLKYVQFNNSWNRNKIILTQLDDFTVTFTANTAGDYYIFYGNDQTGSKAKKTNTIIIHVLPFRSNCLLGDCKPKCSGLDMDELNTYMRLFIPYYINYNIYLINPDGTLCKDCPDFKEMINGYPTNEAITVNKIFHIKTKNGEYLRELRLILWYK